MIKKVLLAASLMVTGYMGWAQSNPELNNFKNQTNVFAPSPNAAALAKYAEIPVNTHTGIPNISVPIYQWKSKRGNASINVGLSYHAGGIKVEDVASNTGTGWALNAGGVITRSVRGIADDAPFGYINKPAIADFNTYRNNGGYYLPDPTYTVEYTTSDTARSNIIAWFNNPSGSDDVLNGLYSGGWDTEQDLFFYNIEGFSGKFVLDKDGNVNKIDVNPLEIAVHYNVSGPYSLKEIDYFTIQGDNGIKYLFDYKESSRMNTMSTSMEYSTKDVTLSVPSFSEQYTHTAFYVSQAVDLNSNDTIRYVYGPNTIKYISGWNESQTYHDNDDPAVWHREGLPTDQKISSHSFSSTCSNISSYTIRKIMLPDSSFVDFYYDKERTDVDGDSALTRIEITDITGASKKYRFKYGYFDSHLSTPPNSLAAYAANQFSDAPMSYTAVEDHFFTRLRLDSIHQLTAWTGGDSLLMYAFTYNDTILPARNCRAIDYWGYYCGPDRSSTTLIPEVFPAAPETVGSEGIQAAPGPVATVMNIFTAGADRTPHALYARASVLKKISMPTGGNTSFEFKTNSIKDTIYHNSNTRYFKSAVSVNDYAVPQDINMPERTDTTVIFYITYKRTNSDGSTYVPPSPDGPLACLADAVSSSFNIIFYVKSTDNTITKSCMFSGLDSGEASLRVYFSLPLNKSYRYYYHYSSPGGSCYDSVFFQMGTNAKYYITNTNNLVGGLRAEAVNYYDPITNKTIRTQYDYRDDSGYVSGIIPLIPNYSYNTRAIGQWSCCGSTQCGFDEFGGAVLPSFWGHAEYKTRTSSSTQTLGYSFGSNAGYTKVSTAKVDVATGATLGKIVERFSGSVIKNYNEIFPYSTTQAIDWKTGHKWEETIYDSTGTLKKRTHSTYLDVLDSSYNEKNRSIRIACIRSENCGDANIGVSALAAQRFVAHAFYPYSGRSFLASQRIAEYSGTDSIVNNASYAYNYDGYMYTATTGPNSKGLSTTKTYRYPTEYSNTALTQLLTNKVRNVPVASRTTQWRTSPTVDNEIQGEGADYDVYGSFARPRYFYQRSSSDATVHGTFDASTVKTDIDETTGEITAYDGYGNVAEFLGRDGIRVAIVWGYKGTVPVAKIIGASYSDALSKLSTITYANLQLVTNETTLRAKLDEIRQGYSSTSTVQVITMTAKPLLGTTSETDANGRTTYYEYDGFGRLKLIRDKDNNILKTFDYKYAQAQNQ